MIDHGGPPMDEGALAALDERITAWLATQDAENPAVDAVARQQGERRWYIRLKGEEKTTSTVWFALGQRTLHYETYVMPAPEENHAALFEHLLRRNMKIYGATFAIGAEDAVYLVGQLANDAVDEVELDRILGSMYAYVEAYFRPAIRIGYASRFANDES